MQDRADCAVVELTLSWIPGPHPLTSPFPSSRGPVFGDACRRECFPRIFADQLFWHLCWYLSGYCSASLSSSYLYSCYPKDQNEATQSDRSHRTLQVADVCQILLCSGGVELTSASVKSGLCSRHSGLCLKWLDVDFAGLSDVQPGHHVLLCQGCVFGICASCAVHRCPDDRGTPKSTPATSSQKATAGGSSGSSSCWWESANAAEVPS